MDNLGLPPDILTTDFVLEPLQIKQVHIIVNDLHSQVLAIEDDVLKVNSEIRRKTPRLRTLRELRAKQRALRKIISRYKALLSPMRAVPPEILVEIFIRCLPPRGTSICAGDAPLLVTRVCSRWRYVAINARHLWTSLSLGGVSEGSNIVADASSFGLNPLLVTQIWLERSGTLPLDIQLMILDWGPKLLKFTGTAMNGRDINKEVMRNLMVHVHRWRHFKAAFFSDTLKEAFRSDVTLRAPMLKSFHICRPRHRWHNPQVMSESGRFHAPSIADFALHTVIITLKSFTIDYHSLRRLSLHSSRVFPIDLCLDTLEHCPFLESFSLTLIEPHVAVQPPRTPMSLPHLRDLCISFETSLETSLEMSAFLRPLRLPRLRTLEFHDPRDPWSICEDFWRAFRALLTRSRPPLHELCLGAASVGRVLIPILRLLPRLEILDFQLAAPDAATLVALTPAPGGKWLCPRLRALYIVNTEVPWNINNIREVIALVKARVPPGLGPWDGGSRPIGPSESDGAGFQVMEGRYLTEVGVWHAKGVGVGEEEKLQALGRKGGKKMRFTIHRYIGREFNTFTAKQFR